MENNQLSRVLDLVAYMSSGNRYTALDLAEMLGITRRNLYNYFHQLADYGFRVLREGHCYELDPRSPFFKRINATIPLSETEAECICHTLAENGSGDALTQRVSAKLARHFGLDGIAADPQLLAKRVNDNKAVLRKAMKTERIVRICNYSSPHSHTVHDRYVEPFLFLNGGRDVRCHEIATHQNKTFKLSRMESVELMDDSWFNKPMHKRTYTDIFMFSGEERHTVTLRLGQLSRNLMLEEYPLSEGCIEPAGDGSHWLFTADVVSFLGIGRFVMGLYDDILVLGDDGFKDYIRRKVEGMKASLPQGVTEGGAG